MDLQTLYNELQAIKTLLETVNTSSKEYLNVKEASEYLSISESTLYKLTSSKSISYYQPNGKLILFKKCDLDSYIEKGRKKTYEEIKEEAKNRIKNLKTF